MWVSLQDEDLHQATLAMARMLQLQLIAPCTADAATEQLDEKLEVRGALVEPSHRPPALLLMSLTPEQPACSVSPTSGVAGGADGCSQRASSAGGVAPRSPRQPLPAPHVAAGRPAGICCWGGMLHPAASTAQVPSSRCSLMPLLQEEEDAQDPEAGFPPSQTRLALQGSLAVFVRQLDGILLEVCGHILCAVPSTAGCCSLLMPPAHACHVTMVAASRYWKGIMIRPPSCCRPPCP